MCPSAENADLWARRAKLAERSVCTSALRRLWGLPGTRMGMIAAPPSPRQRLFVEWHYWWQAHLLDCLVDAQLRSPSSQRSLTARRLVRGSLIRNGFRRTNRYYDDMAWWGLALQRANAVFGWRVSVASILAACRQAINPEGIVPWRRNDVFWNAPANGPVAIMLARAGDREAGATMVSWVVANLLMDDGLIADGLIQGATGSRLVDDRYAYCQGVVLGAELVTGAKGSSERIGALVRAVGRELSDHQVLRGGGGGDGGLFAGILARYLALVALRLPGDHADTPATRDLARALVMASAGAAWANLCHLDGRIVFGPDWATPAQNPVSQPGIPEGDLSVQLSGWMLFEAAARLTRPGPPSDQP